MINVHNKIMVHMDKEFVSYSIIADTFKISNTYQVVEIDKEIWDQTGSPIETNFEKQWKTSRKK